VRDPLLQPFLAFLCGILFSGLAPLDSRELSLGLCALAAVLVLSRWLRLATATRLGWLAVCVTFGLWTSAVHAPGPAPRLNGTDGEVMRIQGCIVEAPEFSPDRTRFVVELEPGARVRVTQPRAPEGRAPQLSYGETVEVDARIRNTHNFGNPGAFDSEAWLARRRIYWQASASPTGGIRRLGSCGKAWKKALCGLHSAVLERIDAAYSATEWRRGMMRALLLADADALQKTWIEDFRRTGTYHAIVVSGTHVSALAACFLFLTRFAGTGQSAALVVTGALAWLYALLCGGDPPVARAAAGFTIFLLARFCYRRTRLLNILAAIAFGYLILDPGQLREASFQLSFLAVAALGSFAAPLLERGPSVIAPGARHLTVKSRDARLEPAAAAFRVELRCLAETLHWLTRVPLSFCQRVVELAARFALFAWSTFLTSAVIQVALALPMIAYFHRMSISGLTANVAVTPLLTIAIPLGFAGAITGLRPLAAATGALLDASRWLAAWHASWEPRWRVPDPPTWLAVCFLGALFLAAWLLRRQSQWFQPSAALALGLLVVMVVHPFRPLVEANALEITTIDVGQGESILLALPGGKLVLVDGGGIPVFGQRGKARMDIGEDVVSPYLWSRGVKRLDLIVMTHSHEDHAGGLAAIAENFRPKELWTSPHPSGGPWEALRDATIRAGTVQRELHTGEKRALGEVKLAVLAAGESGSKNDDSLVLSLEFRGRTALLSGDAGRAVEATILERGAASRVEILKVGHHGSNGASSGEFLDALRPEFGLISAGVGNSYGLPGQTTLNALRSRHIAILRTDLMGLISLRTQGARWELNIPRQYGASSGLLEPF
jgi:competence protein ComEC